MSAAAHSPAQRAQLRQQIAALALAGLSQDKIALELSIGKPLVQYYWRKLTRQWLKDAATDVAAHRARLLAESRQLRQELWEAWRTSDSNKEVTTTKQRRRALNTAATEMPMDQTSEASKRSESRERNPAYADRIQASLDFEARLLGVMRPTPVEIHQSITEIVYEGTPIEPERGRLVVIGGGGQEALPEPEPDSA
jgi:hypothetical protein